MLQVSSEWKPVGAQVGLPQQSACAWMFAGNEPGSATWDRRMHQAAGAVATHHLRRAQRPLPAAVHVPLRL